MNQEQFNKIWQRIDEDLVHDYQELHREHLHRAIGELPSYAAPEHIWLRIEKQIRPLTLRRRSMWVLRVAASVLLLLGLALLLRVQLNNKQKIYYSKVEMPQYDFSRIADTSRAIFDELKNSTCTIKPDICLKDEFKQNEKEYDELLAMQSDILQKASQYDGGDQMETMLLKIESRKKEIEETMISQIN